MNTDKTQIPEHQNNGVGRLNRLAYRDGYIHGRTDEQDIQQENRSIRENTSGVNGLLIGIAATAIAGFLGGSIFLLSHSGGNSTSPGERAPVSTTNPSQHP